MANKTIKAFLWSFLDRFSAEIVSFVIGVILARLLSPYDYGIVGLTTIFVVFSNVFIEAGFSNALIRKVNRTEKDLSTAFYFNVVVGISIYLILFLTSPYIANYFDEDILTILVRIIALNVLLNSLSIVQNAILTANLNIRLQALINFAAQVISGLAAIFCAYKGLGLYSLVVQSVASTFLRTVFLWIFTKWRPREHFSKESFIYLWGFGSKLLLATTIGTAFNQIYTILIGKYIGKNELGYYSKGNSLANHVSTIGNGVIQKVTVPILAGYQQDYKLLRDKFRELMKLLVLIMAPICAICFFCAEDIIVFLWTDKWLEASNMFKFLILGVMWQPIGNLSLCLLQVVNKTGLILKLEFPKKFMYVIIIIAGFRYGIYGLLIGHVLINIIASVVNMIPTKRILLYSYFGQLYDILRYILLAFVIGYIVSFIVNTDLPIIDLVLFIFIYLLLFIGFLYLIKDDIFMKYSSKLFKKQK